MRLIFDMDNTLADFDGNGGINAMYDERFFADLVPYANVVETLKALKVAGLEMFIVSACIDSPYCETEKMEWVEKYLPFFKKENVLLVPYGTNKAKAFAEFTGKEISRTDVLFDDYKVNLKAWAEIGGTAVKCGKVYKANREYKQVIEFAGIAEALATV